MKKKLIATVMAATMAVTALTGCGSSSASSAKKDIKVPTEPFGDTVKYDPSVEINDGKDISIDMWEWGSDELFQKVIDRYTAIHPNVTINLVDNPWEDYWTKLPLALDGENGPALFDVHNSYHENLINYMAPLDIPVEDLEQDFNGVSAHEIDGKVYYIDYGMMTGSVYYNKEDGKTPNVNSDAMKKVMQMLVDMYDKDQIGSKDFGENCADSFGQGQSAMVIQWGHYYNTLKTTWSDIDFGVFEIPTFDGNPYAYNRYNGESTFGVNKKAPKDQQAVAQDFVKFFLCDDESQVDFNLAMSTFPAKKSLADNEEILKNPSLKVLSEHIDHYIWPGPMPSCVEEDMKKAGEDIFYNGVDIDTALDKAQADIIKDMKNSSFQSVENLYEFAK